MYLNKTSLINERGWSMKLIESFLGEPDDIKPLGRYAEEHRFWLPRIENVEKREEFKSAQAKYLARRTAGKQAAKTQTQKRIEAARTMIVRVRRLSESDVLNAAIDHYNDRRRYYRRRYDDDDYGDGYYKSPAADKDSDPRFLERITVNYIRHELTSYDAKLLAQRGRVGGDRAAQIIRRRVFEEIICAYPHLGAECDRQMLERELISEIEIENKYKAQWEQLRLPF